MTRVSAALRRGAPAAALSMATLLASLSTSIVSVALPAVADAFDASFAAVQWIVLAYLIATTTLIVGIGRVGDIIGRRRLLLVGIGVFACATAASGAASDLAVLIAARALQGAGAAAMLGMALASTASLPGVPLGRRLGLLGSMSASGTALGPAIGGMLVAWSGWRAVFFATLLPAVFCWFLAHSYLPADHPATSDARGMFDSPGMLLLAMAPIAA